MMNFMQNIYKILTMLHFEAIKLPNLTNGYILKVGS
jgi:hypothetical protein